MIIIDLVLTIGLVLCVIFGQPAGKTGKEKRKSIAKGILLTLPLCLFPLVLSVLDLWRGMVLLFLVCGVVGIVYLTIFKEK